MVKLNESLVNYDEWSELMDYFPVSLCEIQNKTKGYLETQIGVQLHPQSEELNYTCETGFNATLDHPPTSVDLLCDDELETLVTPQHCRGNIHHSDFFTKMTNYLEISATTHLTYWGLSIPY
jgi:hypothetical protein